MEDQEAVRLTQYCTQPEDGLDCDPDGVCRRVIRQRATISVPICIAPVVYTQGASAQCWGPPSFTPIGPCHTVVEGCCRFIMSQNICVTVPVEFSAEAITGEPSIRCHIPGFHDGIPCRPCSIGEPRPRPQEGISRYYPKQNCHIEYTPSPPCHMKRKKYIPPVRPGHEDR